MSSKSTQTASSTAKPIHRSSAVRPKAGTHSHLTSATIAEDIAAFKKRGGHIEVLGNTPLRAPPNSFHSKATTTTATKSAPANAAKKTARAKKTA